MSFKHGVYGAIEPFTGQLPITGVGTNIVYVGTAPIHRLNTAADPLFDYASLINEPLVLSSYDNAVGKLGYIGDFGTYTLEEAVMAHFRNGVQAIGNIIAINMLNPASHTKQITGLSVPLVGASVPKVGIIADMGAVIETVVITSAGVTFESGDITLEYVDTGIQVTINKTGFAPSTVTAAYKQIDVTDSVITTTVLANALKGIDKINAKLGLVPNVIVAPKYTAKPTYHEVLINKVAERIGKKWGTILISDIDASSNTTADAAISWKGTNSYTSKLDMVCYPKGKLSGTIYHLSTLAAVRLLLQDTTAGGVPYDSPSNKDIFATSACLADGTEIFFDEETANLMNQSGITTVNYIGGSLRLWGGIMGNYDYTAIDSINPEDRSDTGVRMALYLVNTLQYKYLDHVDRPFRRKDIDGIKASVQMWLNSLVADGKYLYASIDFISDSNPTSEMVNGDFVFDVAYTSTPNGKSITFKVKYTLDGLASLTGGEE